MRWLGIGLMILGASFLIWHFVLPAEPIYQGRTITSWQDEWATGKANSYREALMAIGTNGLPYAVRSLALNDSRLHTNYANFYPKIPLRFQKFFPKPKPGLKEVDGANMFLYAGSNSLPFAISLLKNGGPTPRRSAAWGLGGFAMGFGFTNQVIPPLIDALADEDQRVRFNATGSLGRMGSAASNAVPALIRILADTGIGPQTNSYFYLRAVAANALGKIGPAARNSLPDLKAALGESNSYLRGQTAVAIWRINGDIDTTLPVLLREMPANPEDNKWDWIIALGEMGPRAKNALPQLQIELKDHYSWVRGYVTNALQKISPNTATN